MDLVNGTGDVLHELDIPYAVRDGVELHGDMYRPPSSPDALRPALIFVHGGGWQSGNKKSGRDWGIYLAQRGYVVFSITYRLAARARPSYPQALLDVSEAVRFLRNGANRFGVDAARIGLFGGSAGGHLCALAALNPTDENSRVKTVISAYGIYDLKRQWDHELTVRPKYNLVETFLGKSPMEDREVYFQASPISHVLSSKKHVSFLLAHGLQDNVVLPAQMYDFEVALTQSGLFVRRFLAAEAEHFWLSEPPDEANSLPARFARALLRFLEERL